MCVGQVAVRNGLAARAPRVRHRRLSRHLPGTLEVFRPPCYSPKMGKKIGGWCLLVLAVCGLLLGVLLFIGGLIEKENRFRTLGAGLIVLAVSFNFARLGWQLRGAS